MLSQAIRGYVFWHSLTYEVERAICNMEGRYMVGSSSFTDLAGSRGQLSAYVTSADGMPPSLEAQFVSWGCNALDNCWLGTHSRLRSRLSSRLSSRGNFKACMAKPVARLLMQRVRVRLSLKEEVRTFTHGPCREVMRTSRSRGLHS